MTEIKNRTKRENFAMDAVHKQLDIVGIDHSVLETDREAWFSNNTMTMEQHAEWKIWFIAESRKVFKITKKMAEREFLFFDLSYGLRLNDSSS